MRIATAALLLPALASAQQLPFSDQLNSLWDSISPYLPAYANPYNTTSPINPLHSKTIVNLTASNWAAELGADSSPTAASRSRALQPWLLLITGGNATCGSYNSSCARINEAWSTASAAAKTDSRAPNLGLVDCEAQRLLCATWGAVPGRVWWVEPEVRVTRAADTNAASVTATEAKVEGEVPLDSKAVTDVSREIWVVALNKTTVEPSDFTSLYRKAGEYKKRGELLGHEELLSRHPFNSKLAKAGLNIPVGYVYLVISAIPSWTTIMIISFTARMFTQRAAKATKETPEQKAERERKAKYQENGKVRGAPAGDASR